MTRDQKLMKNEYVAKAVRSYNYGMIDLIEAVSDVIQHFKNNDMSYNEATSTIKLLSRIKTK